MRSTRVARVRAWAAAIAARLRAVGAELATAIAALIGWLSLTAGLAHLLGLVVWPISVGLLLTGLAGWRLIYTVLRDGLYALTRNPDRRRS